MPASIISDSLTVPTPVCTVYLSVLGQDPSSETAKEQQQDTLDALNNAKGFIRREIGHQIKLRHVPDLVFKIDRSMEYGRHISKIIDGLDIDHSDDEGNSL